MSKPKTLISHYNGFVEYKGHAFTIECIKEILVRPICLNLVFDCVQVESCDIENVLKVIENGLNILVMKNGGIDSWDKRVKAINLALFAKRVPKIIHRKKPYRNWQSEMLFTSDLQQACKWCKSAVDYIEKNESDLRMERVKLYNKNLKYLNKHPDLKCVLNKLGYELVEDIYVIAEIIRIDRQSELII